MNSAIINELKKAVAAADTLDARYGTPQTAWRLGEAQKALRAAEAATKGVK